MRDESLLFEADVIDAQPRRSTFAVVVSAVAAVAVVAALGAWAWRLGVRDPGSVPVIRAMQGPVKTMPDDPGGVTAPHQQRAVYGLVGAAPALPEGPATAAAPEPLADEDQPIAEAASPAPPPAAAPPEPVESLVDQLVAEALRATVAADPPVVAAMISPTDAAALLAPPPARRPPPPASARAALPDAMTVQLGAYLTESDARANWAALAARTDGLLRGRAPDISRLEGGGRTLYRLRAAPFTDAQSARALCATLRQTGEDCIVVGAD